ncbi:hypothetical protein CR513_47169, partial [Mucuna pruriens]
MRRYVHHVCERLVCRSEKSKVSPHGFYTPLSIPISLWCGHFYGFCLRIIHFIPYHKIDDACHVVNLFFREVARLHGLPKTIVSYKVSKGPYGVSLVPRYSSLPLVILKWIDKLKWLNENGLPKAQFVKKLHERVHSHIDK